MSGVKRNIIKNDSQLYDFFVYKTINTINNKFYIGSHCGLKINNPKQDSYLGSGARLKLAIKKYGVESFKREIISQHKSIDEMFQAEREILSQYYNDDNCYNLSEIAGGGDLGRFKFKSILQINKFGEVIKEHDGVTILPSLIPHTKRAWNVAAYLTNRTDTELFSAGGFLWILKDEFDQLVPERFEKALNAKRVERTNNYPSFCLIMDIHLHDNNTSLVEDCFEQLIRSCKEKKVNILFQGGDVFHSRKSLSIKVMSSWSRILDRLQQEGITMYSISGNHDKTDQELEFSWLSIWKYHPSFIVLEKQTSFNWLNGDIDFHFLPFFPENGSYIERLNELTRSLDLRKKNILLTHIGIMGGLSHNGLESSLSPELFKAFDQVYVAHYHNENVVCENIHYLGSLYQANYGEDFNKGVNWLYQDGTIEKQILDFPQYIKYEVDVTQLTTTALEELKKEKELSNNNFRIILKGTEKDLRSFNLQSIRELGISVQLKQEDIKIDELEQRVEAFNSVTLRQEFTSFCKKEKLSEKEGLKYFNQISSTNVQTEAANN